MPIFLFLSFSSTTIKIDKITQIIQYYLEIMYLAKLQKIIVKLIAIVQYVNKICRRVRSQITKINAHSYKNSIVLIRHN